MGICIGYSGRLDDAGRYDELISFVKQAVSPWQWTTHDVIEQVSGLVLVAGDGPPRLAEETVRGVWLQPPDTETIMLTFDAGGSLCHYLEVPPELVAAAVPGETYFLSMPHWVKTTGACVSHARIVALFRTLRKTFMSRLEVNDDTGFWDTLDFERLEYEHLIMSSLIGAMSKPDVLSAVLRGAGHDIAPESIIEPVKTNLTLRREPLRAAAAGKAGRRVN